MNFETRPLPVVSFYNVYEGSEERRCIEYTNLRPSTLPS